VSNEVDGGEMRTGASSLDRAAAEASSRTADNTATGDVGAACEAGGPGLPVAGASGAISIVAAR
jgi:hypothetical protein